MERHLASVLPRARSPRVLSVPRYGRGVLSRWLGGFAALVVTLVTGALVILDVTDDGLRRWWSKRSPWAATAKTPG